MNFENVIQHIRKMENPGVYVKADKHWSNFDLTVEEYLADDWYVEENGWARRESWPIGAYIRPAP
jgi:hypothetical protein